MISRTTQLRQRLAQGTVVLPGAFNAITAMLVEQAGFEAVYISGAGLANSVGFPDVGLLTLTEVAQWARYIADAVSIPAICDADTGFGEAVNVGRAVREFERAGVAGIHIEDQEFPKKCGHLSGKRLMDTEAMVEKIQAAVAARPDPDFLLIARTDARGVTGMSDAIARAQRYVEAGADAIFPEAMESAEEFALFAREVAPAFAVKSAIPLLLANMTEFGKSPYLTVQQFAEMGYRLVIFPMTNFRVMLKAVQDALRQLKQEGTQQGFLDRMMTRKELYELLKYEG
jgi:methylisocitrate lyase